MTKKEFVSMSLPYKLKVVIPESDERGCRKTVIGTVGVVYDDGSITCHDTVNSCPKWYKPVLYPFPVKFRIELYSYNNVIDLIKKHYDVAGLVEKGQAIDVNSLKVNPYKKK